MAKIVGQEAQHETTLNEMEAEIKHLRNRFPDTEDRDIELALEFLVAEGKKSMVCRFWLPT